MPKRQQYDSDGGFVEDAPKQKKTKSGGNELKRAEGKATVSTEMQKDEEGNEYWEISRTRRVQISEFKGVNMVNIREFYSKDDKMLPGKKGISLTIDQFTAFLDILPDLESTLKSKGISIPRPKYDSTTSAKEDAGEEDEEEDEGEEEEDDPPAKSTSKLSKFVHKANHEATSDEDDDD